MLHPLAACRPLRPPQVEPTALSLVAGLRRSEKTPRSARLASGRDGGGLELVV